MNFFEQQDIARRNTKRLVVLLGLAVLSLILITVLLFAALMYFLQVNSAPSVYYLEGGAPGFWGSLGNLISWEMVSGIALVVTVVVFFGSLFKLLQLRGGGKVVAEAMGGRLISADTRDPDERRILNVVEEMSIASGSPVPPVYILDEDGINAFAAGHTPQDAVIGITRGCIRLLSRDELQGVVAHEFSHIFHGDMRLNIRLVALLNGILLLGLIGEMLVRSVRYRSYSRSSRDNSPAMILGAGVGLMVIGYAGTFFGSLIKAAVSRQREFLADASAVQFTRNPDGISGALKKIGGYTGGSQLSADHTAEYSHMYFSQGIKSGFTSLMATHPPLPDRIRRIEPRWSGQYPKVEITLNNPRPQQNDTGTPNDDRRQAAAVAAATTAAILSGQALNDSYEAIGQPTANHLNHARQLLTEIPPALYDAVHEPFGAHGVIYGLLLSRTDQNLRKQQWQSLLEVHARPELESLQKTARAALGCSEQLRMPLVELALPALKQLSEHQYQNFKKALGLLIRADQQVSLQEWSLYRILSHNLEPRARILRHQDLHSLRNECQLVLSLLANAGHDTSDDAQAAFTEAASTLRLPNLQRLSQGEVSLPSVDEALETLNRLKPLQKPQLLKAMASSILHDGEITLTEAELLRAIADSLDCPVPPLVPNNPQ